MFWAAAGINPRQSSLPYKSQKDRWQDASGLLLVGHNAATNYHLPIWTGVPLQRFGQLGQFIHFQLGIGSGLHQKQYPASGSGGGGHSVLRLIGLPERLLDTAGAGSLRAANS